VVISYTLGEFKEEKGTVLFVFVVDSILFVRWLDFEGGLSKSVAAHRHDHYLFDEIAPAAVIFELVRHQPVPLLFECPDVPAVFEVACIVVERALHLKHHAFEQLTVRYPPHLVACVAITPVAFEGV